jgi:hypothetical protein
MHMVCVRRVQARAGFWLQLLYMVWVRARASFWLQLLYMVWVQARAGFWLQLLYMVWVRATLRQASVLALLYECS